MWRAKREQKRGEERAILIASYSLYYPGTMYRYRVLLDLVVSSLVS
jgi:hypothetical protein